MLEILPGSFLADLCWQQLTLPFVSLQLFVLWVFFNVLMGIRTAFLGFRKLPREQILHQMLVFTSFFFMFFAVYRISAQWIGMQIRHAWNLWPITLVAPYFAIRKMKLLKGINRKWIVNIIFCGLMCVLVPINCLIIYNFIIAYKPLERESRADLNYSLLINYWVQSPDMGVQYLEGAARSDPQ